MTTLKDFRENNTKRKWPEAKGEGAFANLKATELLK
jgi:hypothetical protein